MNYRINFENYRHSFTLPSAVTEDLQNIPSDYLKVILLLLQNADKDYSVNLLTNLLHLTEQTVQDALRYWAAHQVLFLEEQVVPPKTAMVIEPAQSKVRSHSKEQEFVFLMDSLQHVLPRPLTSSDLRTIEFIYDSYRLPADVILMAVQYAVDQGKTSIKYIESVCTGWHQQGITTYAQVEEYFSQAKKRHTHEAQVQTAFGIQGRKLVASEQRFIHTWFEEYHFDLPVIALAYERTIANTGKVAFAYTNKILQNWYQKGYRTVQEIEEQEPTGTKPKSPSGDNSYDLSELDKIMNRKPELKL